MEGIVISPQARDASEVPIISIPDFIFQNLRNKLPGLGAKPWLVSFYFSNIKKY